MRDEAKILLADLLSEAEAKKFEISAGIIFVPIDPVVELRRHREDIKQYIRKLGNYKERIQNFWFRGEIRENRKLIEKALLLMRFYDEKEIYKIGKNMKLEYFDRFNHEEVSYHRGALEISRKISDEELLILFKKNPKDSLLFGGFQGDYYTATEKGELQLTSSWENVRKNIQETLENWDKTAYGLLQAIINKCGTVIDRDVAAEIVKILGPGYPWQDLLPTLDKRRLVFKRYGNWEMPQEILPVVQDELSLYRRHINIFPDIIQARRHINVVFEQKFNTALFKGDEVAMNDIQKPCMNEEDFNNRIQALSILIDKMEIGELKKCTNSSLRGSINILEGFLKKEFPGFDKNLISNFRNIITLRSKRHPIHSDDPRLIDALEYFGFNYPPDDWEKLWKTVLNKYLECLKLLLEYLNTIVDEKS